MTSLPPSPDPDPHLRHPPPRQLVGDNTAFSLASQCRRLEKLYMANTAITKIGEWVSAGSRVYCFWRLLATSFSRITTLKYYSWRLLLVF